MTASLDNPLGEEEFVKVDHALPKHDGEYLVACEGGKVLPSYYVADLESAMNYMYSMSTSRVSRFDPDHHNRESAHFDVCHIHGYKVQYWMCKPKHPDFT